MLKYFNIKFYFQFTQLTLLKLNYEVKFQWQVTFTAGQIFLSEAKYEPSLIINNAKCIIVKVIPHT